MSYPDPKCTGDDGSFEGLADRAMGRRQFTPEEFKEFCDYHDNYFV